MTDRQILGRMDSLQAGRAIAALSVVAYHAMVSAHDFGGSYSPVFSYGWAGVDFFFVLSGFIIAHSVQGKSFGAYCWHRFRRVMLPYWPIGLGFAILYSMLPHVSQGSRHWSWWASAFLWPSGQPALSVAWTLQHELVFYGIFALAWFSNQKWLLAAWGALCLVGFEAIPLQAVNIEFLMGVACYYAVKRGHDSQWLWLVSAAGLVMLTKDAPQQGHSLLLGLVFAFALPPLIRLERNGLNIPKSFIFIGGASYSIYLGHELGISICARLAPGMLPSVCFGIIIGLIYYIAVERVILSRIPKDLPSRSEPAPALRM